MYVVACLATIVLQLIKVFLGYSAIATCVYFFFKSPVYGSRGLSSV